MKLCSSAVLVAVAILLNCGWMNCGKQENSSEQLNHRPTVGILFQEMEDTLYLTQYLAIGDVKWLEAAAARMVPILINQPIRYYQYLMDRINGVLLPGGMVSHVSSSYAKAADIILDMAIVKNDCGIYFPVWGTCQGFQKLVTYFAGNKNTNWITMCRTQSLGLKLDFTPGLDLSRETRMFQNGREIVPILAKFPITYNNHFYCLATEDFYRNSKLTSSLILVSSNTFNGTQFVSTIEHRKYPFFGTQWHPEGPQFFWAKRDYSGQSKHAYSAILAGQYMANFFVNQTRKNHQHFRSEQEELESLLVNFNDYFSGYSYKIPM